MKDLNNDLFGWTERMEKLAGRKRRRRVGLTQDIPHTSIAKVQRNRERKNSRGKGSSYERKIAKLFAAWSGEHIRRTPQSGGWSTARFGVTGDLVCDNSKWPYHIECKKREGWNLDDLITGIRPDDTRSIEAWWRQTIDTCPKKGYQTTPVLVFARNRGPDLVMMYSTDVEDELLDKAVLTLTGIKGMMPRVIITLEAFFSIRPPKPLKNSRSRADGKSVRISL